MTPDEQKAEDERINREADESLVEMIEQRVTDRSDLLKHCLQALVSAGVPLNCQTADVLHELALHIHTLIHEALEGD